MNQNGGIEPSNEELLGNFKRWLELMDQSGLVSDRSIARALGVNHKLIGGARTGSAWRDRNAVRRVCFVLGEAFWRLTPEDMAEWSDAVARGERSTAFEMMEAIESGSYVGEDALADGDSGAADDSDVDSGEFSDRADSGDLADSDADVADSLRVDADGAESAGSGGIAPADSVSAAGSAGVADRASAAGGVAPADSVDAMDSVAPADSVDADGDAGAVADIADADAGSSAGSAGADSVDADISDDVAIGDVAQGADAASADADSVSAPDAAGDAPEGVGIADGGVAGAGVAAAAEGAEGAVAGAPDGASVTDSADVAAYAPSGADAADSGVSAVLDGGAAAARAGDAADAAAGAGDSAAGGATGADAGGFAAAGVDLVVSADDGDDVVSGDASAGDTASEDAGDTAAAGVGDTGAHVGDAAGDEGVMPSDVSAAGHSSVRAAGTPPRDGAVGTLGVMRGRKRGLFGIFGRRRDVVISGVSRAGDLGSVTGVSGVSRVGGAAGASSAGADDAPSGDAGATAASSGDAGVAGADASADAGAGADAGDESLRFDGLGVDPGILDIRRRMEQWTKKVDGDAAKAEWEAREDPEGEIAYLRRAVEQADSVDVIAQCCAGPVLREIPELSLEDARTAALMKIDGWTPTGGGDKPPGLYGDAPLLFHLGVECSYADEGARAVAFAPNLAYEDEVGYSAVRLRYGLTPYDRMARYFCEDYLARPKRAGFYRHSNRLPERPYPDSDWFFGCTGLPRPGGVWMPSIAEVAAFYYMVKEMIEGFVGTAGEESEYVEHLRLLLLECQYLLFDPDYWITMHYHQEGKSIGGSTRVFERQTLADQIRITDNALARLRRRRLRRRALRFVLRALSWPARALWRRLRGRRDADIPEDALGEVVGESSVGLRWAERDRTRWYEPGVGALSDQGDGWLAQLPDAMAEVWGGVARPRVRSVPGEGERRYRHGKWRIPRKLS